MNNQAVITNEIMPHLREIEKICATHKIPFFFSIVKENTEEKTEYFAKILSSKVSDVRLTEDLITKHINVANGFDTVPKRYEHVFMDF